MGNVETIDGPPTIAPVNPFPIAIDSGGRIMDSAYVAPYNEMHPRIEKKDGSFFGPDFNLNKTLTDAIAGQDIVKTQTFTVLSGLTSTSTPCS
jgi:hypothetical protein